MLWIQPSLNLENRNTVTHRVLCTHSFFGHNMKELAVNLALGGMEMHNPEQIHLLQITYRNGVRMQVLGLGKSNGWKNSWSLCSLTGPISVPFWAAFSCWVARAFPLNTSIKGKVNMKSYHAIIESDGFEVQTGGPCPELRPNVSKRKKSNLERDFLTVLAELIGECRRSIYAF